MVSHSILNIIPSRTCHDVHLIPSPIDRSRDSLALVNYHCHVCIMYDSTRFNSTTQLFLVQLKLEREKEV